MRRRFQPLRELESEQFSEQRAHRNAGVVMTPLPDAVLFLFIKSTIWTIKRQFHKSRKGDDAVGGYFTRNFFGHLVQLLQCGANLATSQPDRREFYG